MPKKPKNLFMMLDFQRGFCGAPEKSAEDEYTFEDSEAETGFEVGRLPSTSSAAAKRRVSIGGLFGGSSDEDDFQVRGVIGLKCF